MKQLHLIMFFSVTLSTSLLFMRHAEARDTLHTWDVQEALQHGEQTGVILSNVKVYFAGQTHPGIAKPLGEFRTNKKTNAFNKSDKEACQWAFFSAVKSLQERALAEGGDAVIDIKSNYKSREFVSAIEFQCGAGVFVAGVALKGTVVKLK